MPPVSDAQLISPSTSTRAPRTFLLADAPGEAPAHIRWAEDLIDNVAPEYNAYATSPSYITWEGVGGAIRYENRTVCATFLTCLLKQAYGLTTTDMKTWLGSTSPSSQIYHDAIVAENGFARVLRMEEVLPGDVLAIRYDEDGSVTGHIAIVASAPAPRLATRPLIAGTTQFEVTVLDSSSSVHGSNDSRIEADGTLDTGAGRGVMRLYADADGTVIGYTWSTSTGSVFYGLDSTRHLVVGRLNR